MIWMTWRQFRTQAIAGLAVLAAVAAVLVSTVPGLSGLARDSGYLGCTADCDELAAAFLRQAEASHFAPLYYAGLIVQYLMPALVGMFWGAPLVARELETGTYRLVCSQTVSRGRWLRSSWPASASPRWRCPAWSASPSPGGPAARQGSAAGCSRRSSPRAGSSRSATRRSRSSSVSRWACCCAAPSPRWRSPWSWSPPRLVAAPLLREHLAQASTYAQPLTADFDGGIGISPDDPSLDIRIFPEAAVPGAWVLNSQVVDAAGLPYHGPYDPAYCGLESTAGPQGCKKWLADQNLTHTMVYLGRNTFWTLQWRELGVFLGISALLAIFCFWWIRRRVA